MLVAPLVTQERLISKNRYTERKEILNFNLYIIRFMKNSRNCILFSKASK